MQSSSLTQPLKTISLSNPSHQQGLSSRSTLMSSTAGACVSHRERKSPRTQTHFKISGASCVEVTRSDIQTKLHSRSVGGAELSCRTCLLCNAAKLVFSSRDCCHCFRSIVKELFLSPLMPSCHNFYMPVHSCYTILFSVSVKTLKPPEVR